MIHVFENKSWVKKSAKNLTKNRFLTAAIAYAATPDHTHSE
jgi:hypothetical protein